MDNVEERKIIKKVVKQLVGLPKMDVFDILFKTEQLFGIIEDPNPKIIDAILYSWDNPRDISSADGSFYQLADYTYNLRLYVLTYPNSILSVFRNKYHFKTPYTNQLKKFTKKNVLKSFKNTSMEVAVFEFLKRNELKKLNQDTNRFRIIEHIERMEF